MEKCNLYNQNRSKSLHCSQTRNCRLLCPLTKPDGMRSLTIHSPHHSQITVRCKKEGPPPDPALLDWRRFAYLNCNMAMGTPHTGCKVVDIVDGRKERGEVESMRVSVSLSGR